MIAYKTIQQSSHSSSNPPASPQAEHEMVPNLSGSGQSSPSKNCKEQRSSKYGLRALKLTHVPSTGIQIKCSNQAHVTSDKCVKKRAAKMESKRTSFPKLNDQYSTETKIHESIDNKVISKKYSSLVQTNQFTGANQLDILSASNVSLGIEYSKHSYQIEKQSQIQPQLQNSAQKSSSKLGQPMRHQTAEQIKYTGKRAFPSLYSFIQRREQKQQMQDKSFQSQNDIDPGHYDSCLKRSISQANQIFTKFNQEFSNSQPAHSPQLSLPQPNLPQSPILAFKRVIRLNQKVWPAQSSCNQELLKCNTILKSWIPTDKATSSNTVATSLDDNMKQVKIETVGQEQNLQKCENLTQSVQAQQSFIAAHSSSHEQDKVESKLSRELPHINKDLIRLHNEYERQEEAMTFFLNEKIKQSETDPKEFNDTINQFLENQVKLRQILNTLIEEQNTKQPSNITEEKDLDKILNQNCEEKRSPVETEIQVPSMIKTESLVDYNNCQNDQEQETSNQTQGSTISAGSPHYTCQMKTDQNIDIQDCQNINTQAEALVELISQMMVGMNNGSQDTPDCPQNQSGNAACGSDQNLVETMKEAINCLQNKIY